MEYSLAKNNVFIKGNRTLVEDQIEYDRSVRFTIGRWVTDSKSDSKWLWLHPDTVGTLEEAEEWAVKSPPSKLQTYHVFQVHTTRLISMISEALK